MTPIDWVYWIPRLAWCGFASLVAGVAVLMVTIWAEERELRAYNRGWGNGYRAAQRRAAFPGDLICPDCGRDLFTTETILPDGSLGCECRLTRQERER